jgi:hypothetical protein
MSLPTSHSGSPLPKYLINTDTRAVIDAIESVGFIVDMRVPAPGSVSVTITSPDGHSRNQIGRSDDMEKALRTVAQHIGIEFDEE